MGKIDDNPLFWPPLEQELAPFLRHCRGIVLNAGAGQREIKFGTRDLNIDIVPETRPHVIGDLHRIPLLDDSVDTVVSIAVLEHTRFPWIVAEEFFRVLRPGGTGVIAIPFLQPQHACPHDFVRFTEAGLIELMQYVGFEVAETAHVHHFGQTLAWLLWEYLQHNRPHWLTEPLWVALIKRLSRGRLLKGDSPNTHNTHYVVVHKPGEPTLAQPYYLDALARDEGDDWFFPLLACPLTLQPLQRSGDGLVSADRTVGYGFRDGILDLVPKDMPLPRSRAIITPSEVSSPAAAPPLPAAENAGQLTPWMTSEASFKVSFRLDLLERLREARPARVALLVSSEYEGIFRNGGVGTHSRTLSEQLAEDGWCVILLLTYTEQTFGGHSDFPSLRHVFSTRELPDVLTLQSVHRDLLAAHRHDTFDYEGLSCLFFAQAVTDCFPDTPIYIEFPEMMGAGYRTSQARRAGLLGSNCVVAVTMHSSHEWVFEANEKYTDDDLVRLWQVCFYEQASFEDADLVFFPSHFLKTKVESFGWRVDRAIHMPYFIPIIDRESPVREDRSKMDDRLIPIVFFGRLEERKGLCTFVEAIRALEPHVRGNIHVVFLGKVVPLYSGPLRHLDSRAYIDRELTGVVPYTLLSDLYSAEAIRYVQALRCPIVCLTSPQENFPNSALEMGQVPVRLVVSDTGGFRETLGLVQRSAGVYWFEPKNARSLSATLARAVLTEEEALPIPNPDAVTEINRALRTRKMTHIREALSQVASSNEEKPLVTVGVVSGNPQRDAMDCLRSIAAQTYPVLEVLVLDNRGAAAPAVALDRARSIFPQYQFLHTETPLSVGAARNYLARCAAGRYVLVIDPDTLLAPFAVEQLVSTADRTGAAIVSAPSVFPGTLGAIVSVVASDLPGLLRGQVFCSGVMLVSLKFCREFPYLDDYDGLTCGTEVLAAALAVGEPITYYPYPLSKWYLTTSADRDNSARLKRQYQLRQYIAQIPPARWSRRQLQMLLTATHQLQIPAPSVVSSLAPQPPQPEGHRLRETLRRFTNGISRDAKALPLDMPQVLRIAKATRNVVPRVLRRVYKSFSLLHWYRRRSMVALIASSELFDHAFYLAQNPDVRDSKIDPVVHYLLHGAMEGRDPGPGFCTAYYLEANPDVVSAGVNPLVHYISHGVQEGRPIRPPTWPNNPQGFFLHPSRISPGSP